MFTLEEYSIGAKESGVLSGFDEEKGDPVSQYPYNAVCIVAELVISSMAVACELQ